MGSGGMILPRGELWRRVGHFRDLPGEVSNGLKLELAPMLPLGLVRIQTVGPHAQSFCLSCPGVGFVREKKILFPLPFTQNASVIRCVGFLSHETVLQIPAGCHTIHLSLDTVNPE